MLSSSQLMTRSVAVSFILHFSTVVLSQVAAAAAIDAKSQEDSSTATKGTMLFQSNAKVFPGVLPNDFDEFDDLADEFDREVVHSTGARAGDIKDEVYGVGEDALPAILKELTPMQRKREIAWSELATTLMFFCSRFGAFFQDFFLVWLGFIGFFICKGHSPSGRMYSANEPADRQADFANHKTVAAKLDADELVQAMYSHNKDDLQALRQERSADASEEIWGCTALHVAAHCDNALAAEALLMRGASANLTDTWDETPLHFAARSGSAQVCKLLIERGAYLDAINARDWTPLVVAAHAGQEAVCKLLLSYGAGAGGLTDQELPPLLSSLIVRNIFETSAEETDTQSGKVKSC